MPFLLLYLGEGQKFDQEAVAHGLQALEGATPTKSSGDCLLTYQYGTANDFTIIRFKEDRETIVIDGDGEASLSVALHIQTNYPEDVHLIDEAYSFDLVLRGISSPHELEQQIKNAGG
jgi:hypothetical protein